MDIYPPSSKACYTLLFLAVNYTPRIKVFRGDKNFIKLAVRGEVIALNIGFGLLMLRPISEDVLNSMKTITSPQLLDPVSTKPAKLFSRHSP